MTNYMSSDDVESFLTHILSPVYRILEDDTIRDVRMGKTGPLECRPKR
jgi:U3 small nucleolar RNA-associated protein 20